MYARPAIIDNADRLHMHRHALDRARGRYHIRLTPGDLQEIVRRIEAGHPTVVRLGEPEGPRQRYAIYWHDLGERPAWFTSPWSYRWMFAVYSERTRTIVTFLPRRRLEPWRCVLGRAKRKAKSSLKREIAASNGWQWEGLQWSSV